MYINNIKTNDLELTEELRGYVGKRLDKLDKYIQKGETDIVCEVELSKTSEYDSKGQIYYAEINLWLAGEQFRATNYEKTMHAAIDQAKDEIALEMKRKKDKEKTKEKKEGRKIKNMMKGIVGKFRR